MKYLLALTLALSCSLSLATPSAYAQSGDSRPVVEPSSAQLELNNRGVKAIVAKDYAKAVRLFRSSIDLGELNITYVNMGRAYQYMGECEKAEAAFANALKAPAVAAPSADKIAAVITRYRQELDESCAQVEETPKPTLPTQEDVDDKPAPEEASKSVKPIPQPAEASVAPYIWMGSGTAAVVAAVLIDTLPASSNNEEYDTLDYVPPGLYVLGGAAIVYGIYTLLE